MHENLLAATHRVADLNELLGVDQPYPHIHVCEESKNIAHLIRSSKVWYPDTKVAEDAATVLDHLRYSAGVIYADRAQTSRDLLVVWRRLASLALEART